MNFNNFYNDNGEDESVNYNDFLVNSTMKMEKKSESELAEMEEDGGLTITSLGILGLIIAALSIYVLYWFCCSNSSKGYRQSSHFMNGGYYDDDIDTDEYQIKHGQRQQYINSYNERINGGHNQYDDDDDDDDENSDWSE